MPPAGYKPPERECAAAGCPRTARVSRQLCSKHARLHAKRKLMQLKEGRVLGHIPREMKLALKSVPLNFNDQSGISKTTQPPTFTVGRTRRSPRDLQAVRYQYNSEEEDEEEENNTSLDDSENEELMENNLYTLSIGQKLFTPSSPSSASSSPLQIHNSTTPSPSRLHSPCSSPTPSPAPSTFFIPIPQPIETAPKITAKAKKEAAKRAKKFTALAQAVMEAVSTDYDLQTFEANVLARRNSISSPANLWSAIPQLQASSLSMALPTRLPPLSYLPLAGLVPFSPSPSPSHITLCPPTAAQTQTINLVCS